LEELAVSEFWIGFEKRAAPKWVKKFRTGDLNIGNLARVAKETGKERFIKPLGEGAEGVADLVSHPESPNGLAVRKIFDPKAPGFSSEGFLIRSAIHKLLAHKFPRNTTAFYGIHPSKPIMYREFIPEKLKIKKKLEKAAGFGLGLRMAFSPEGAKSGIGKAVLDRMNKFLHKAQLPGIIDVHEGNVLKGVRGNKKIIDFLPEGSEDLVSRLKKHKVSKNLRNEIFMEKK
jgi:hypothetical protein